MITITSPCRVTKDEVTLDPAEVIKELIHKESGRYYVDLQKCGDEHKSVIKDASGRLISGQVITEESYNYLKTLGETLHYLESAPIADGFDEPLAFYKRKQ